MKKLLSIVLVIIMLTASFPLYSINTSAATPATIDVTEARSRLNTLISAFNGKYFTVNQQACGTNLSDHGCSNCLASSVANTSWCKNLVGKYPASYDNVPAQYYPSGSRGSVDGYSCYGFANYIHWCIFATYNGDYLTSTLEKTGAFNSSTLSYARPGDVIRFSSGHSVVYIGHDSSGVDVLDCNWRYSSENYVNCKVHRHTINYSFYPNDTIAITGVTNYDRSLTPATYTVSYNANGGSGAPASQTKTSGVNLTLSSTVPTKNYTITYNANGGTVSPASKTVSSPFVRWNTNSNGTGTSYNPGGTYSANANATLYAQWSNATAGTLAVPTRTGYVFDGWFSAANGGNQITSSSAVTGNTTVYAHWSFDDTSITDISVKTLPTKTEYIINEPFSATGLTIEATYPGGETRTISEGFSVSGFDSTAAGTKTVAVTYAGHTATFEVEVVCSNAWSDWMLAEDLPEEVANDTTGTYEIEYADGYKYREKETVTNGYPSYSGWTKDSEQIVSTTYGNWQLTAPATSDTQGAAYHTIVTSENISAYDSYAWVGSNLNYFWKENTDNYKYLVHFYSSVSLPSSGYAIDSSDGSYICPKTISVGTGSNLGTVYLITVNGSSVSSFTVNYSCGYYWPNGSTTLYRSKTVKKQYTHSRWGEWSDMVLEAPAASSTVDVQTIEDGYVRYRNSSAHIYDEGVVTTQPTCMTDGVMTYTCVNCGETYTESISALGHDYEAVVTEATCIDAGFTTYICTRCEDSYVSDEVAATGEHNIVNGVCMVCGFTPDPIPNAPAAIVEDKTVKAGDEVTVNVTLENTPNIKSIAISEVSFDASVLEMLGAEWSLTNPVLARWDENTGKGVATLSSATDLNGNTIFTLTFSVSDNAQDGVYTLTLKVSAKDANNADVAIQTVAGSVTVRSVLLGDLNGDDMVTDEDAIYLLFYTFFPEDYPINQNADFNGDGSVTDEDAIYLLFFTFFPDDYPLN